MLARFRRSVPGSVTRAAAVALTLAAVAHLAAAQAQPASPSAQGPVFRTGTQLARVRFQVVRESRYVSGVTAADIRLLDNGAERPIEFFEGAL